MAKLRSTLVRQRWPFFPLVLLGAAGVIFANFVSWPAWISGIAAGLGLVAFLLRRGGWAGFALFLFASFALLQLWQSRESGTAEFADWLGSRKLLVEATGVVSNEPRVFESGSSSFEIKLHQLHLDGAEIPGPPRVIANWKGAPPVYGDVVELRGVLGNLPPPRNPGQFDFASWSQRQGIYSSVQINHPDDGKIVGHGEGNALVALSLRLRHWMAERLSAGINDPTVSELILAMVLGDTSSVDQQIQEDFRGTGTFHLFSVSGLHVGILAVILWYALKPLRFSRPTAAGIIIPLLFFYALMTGLKPASLRAAMMAAVVLAGLMTRRQPILFNNLCAAGFLILLMDTNQLFNPGFQLSFTVVAAILLLGEPLVHWMEKPFLPDPFLPQKLLSPLRRMLHLASQKMASVTSTSLAAWLGSFPLTLGYFHLVSLSALGANLVAIPISFGIMGVSTLSLGASLASNWVSEIFNQTNWLLTEILLLSVHFFAVLPGSYFYVATPDLRPPLAEIVVFDFGVGGAASITSGGKKWLLDCGPSRAHDSTLVPFLRRQGVLNLDGLLLTHGDAQHIGAATALLRSCPPRLIIDSPWKDRSSTRSNFQQEATRLSQPKRLARAGDVVAISADAKLHILHPSAKIGGVADDQAVVTRLDVGSTRVLFLSDGGHATERWLLENVREALACDILVKGVHRDGGELSDEFLEAAHPRLLVTTVTDFPRSEQMTEDWENKIAAHGIQLLRQDQTGAVTINIRAKSWDASGFVNHQQITHEQ